MARAIAFIRAVFFWLLVVLVFFTYCPLLWLMSLGKPRPDKVFLGGARHFARFLLWFSGSRVTVVGRENLPEQTGAIIAVNHQSAFDIFLLLAYLPPNFYFTMKEELFHIPCFSWVAKKSGYISIARSNPLAASRALQRTIGLLERGDNILIFPEGTRSYRSQVGRFKRGIAEMAVMTKAPVLPVVIDGSYRALGRKLFDLRRAEIRMTILPRRRLPAGLAEKRANSSVDLQRWVDDLREDFVRTLAAGK